MSNNPFLPAQKSADYNITINLTLTEIELFNN